MFKKRRQRILNDFQETVKKFHNGGFGVVEYEPEYNWFWVDYKGLDDSTSHQTMKSCTRALKKYMKMQSILSSEIDDD